MKDLQCWIKEESSKLGYNFESLTKQQQNQIISSIMVGLENGFRSRCNSPDLRFARRMKESLSGQKKNSIDYTTSSDEQCFYGSDCLNLCNINQACHDGCLDAGGGCLDGPACEDGNSCSNTTNCIDTSSMTQGCQDNNCSNAQGATAGATCWDQGGLCTDSQCVNGSSSSNDICINDVGCTDIDCTDYRCFNRAPLGTKCSTDIGNCQDINCMEIGRRQAPFDADRKSCPHMADHSAESCIDHVCDPPDENLK